MFDYRKAMDRDGGQAIHDVNGVTRRVDVSGCGYSHVDESEREWFTVFKGTLKQPCWVPRDQLRNLPDPDPQPPEEPEAVVMREWRYVDGRLAWSGGDYHRITEGWSATGREVTIYPDLADEQTLWDEGRIQIGRMTDGSMVIARIPTGAIVSHHRYLMHDGSWSTTGASYRHDYLEARKAATEALKKLKEAK